MVYKINDSYKNSKSDYFKFLKFAFGRATDLACLHIRRDRIKRQEALNLVKIHDGKFPWQYLGVSLEDILKEIDMPIDEFVKVCDRFTNKKLFLCGPRGNLIKDTQGNLTKINYDNAG